jgi:1-acyl-sn-glycerol-3-phosphate acyltransferase
MVAARQRFQAGGQTERSAPSVLPLLKLIVVGVDTALIAPIVVAVAAVDERAAYRVCRFWAWLNLRVCGVQVRSRRAVPLDPDRPYVFMSNHRSQYDILAVVNALADFQLRWVAKKELTRVPVFGWALRHAGHIIIDRSDHEQAVASLRAARARMLEGISVVIFPEGTRSHAGEVLLPFKKGGFMLALETGFPIVPVVVLGSREILPRGSRRPLPGDIDVVVGPPIDVCGVGRDELMERVRAFMLDALGHAQDGRARVAAEAV